MSEDSGKSEQTAEAKEIINKLKSEFEGKMLDDLNTAHILTGAYQDALKFINASIGKLKVFCFTLLIFLCLLTFITINTKLVWFCQILQKMQKKQRMSLLVSLVEIEKTARKFWMCLVCSLP